MAPVKENSITLAERKNYLGQPITAINFQFHYQEKVKALWDIFAEELLRSGLGRVSFLPESARTSGGGHFMGTTRMGSSPLDSVVDKNSKIHDLENLYVAGSSIFPAGGAANPTFSIVAFALRLSDHLAERIQGKS